MFWEQRRRRHRDHSAMAASQSSNFEALDFYAYQCGVPTSAASAYVQSNFETLHVHCRWHDAIGCHAGNGHCVSGLCKLQQGGCTAAWPQLLGLPHWLRCCCDSSGPPLQPNKPHALHSREVNLLADSVREKSAAIWNKSGSLTGR